MGVGWAVGVNAAAWANGRWCLLCRFRHVMSLVRVPSVRTLCVRIFFFHGRIQWGGSRGSEPPFDAHCIGFLTLGPKLDPLPPFSLLVDLRWAPLLKNPGSAPVLREYWFNVCMTHISYSLSFPPFSLTLSFFPSPLCLSPSRFLSVSLPSYLPLLSLLSVYTFCSFSGSPVYFLSLPRCVLSFSPLH